MDKAFKVIGVLSRRMGNLGNLATTKRRLYSLILEAIIAYSTPIWYKALEDSQCIALLNRTQKIGLNRVIAAYRITSNEALCVLAKTLPIEIKITERKRFLNPQRKSTRKEVDP